MCSSKQFDQLRKVFTLKLIRWINHHQAAFFFGRRDTKQAFVGITLVQAYARIANIKIEIFIHIGLHLKRGGTVRWPHFL